MKWRGRLLRELVMVVFACLGVVLALALVACGGTSSQAPNTPPAANPSAAESSSAAVPAGQSSDLASFPAAQEAVNKVAGDAVLVSLGAGRIAAITNLDHSWAYLFYSPSQNQPYSVVVDGGVAKSPEALAAPDPAWTVSDPIDVDALGVGAAEAVTKARKLGERSGRRLTHVQVSGWLSESTPAAAFGIKSGIWDVMLASGPDMADALSFQVDMRTGAVTDVTN
jgi:hypothetical protein